jgi:hypothetical protein
MSGGKLSSRSSGSTIVVLNKRALELNRVGFQHDMAIAGITPILSKLSCKSKA